MSVAPSIGTPLFTWPTAPSGMLFTYAAGGTTPLATYSDAAGTVPNSNPVILDSTGSAIVRGYGAYHLLLKDSTGATTLWDEDNLLYGVPQNPAYTLDTGTVNALAVVNPAIQVVTGTRMDVVIGNVNTSIFVTMAVNGGTAFPLYMMGSTTVNIGQLQNGLIASMVFQGASWAITNLAVVPRVTYLSAYQALQVNACAYTPRVNLGNSGTAITVNMLLSNVFMLTMTGNVAGVSWTLSNPSDGQTFNIFIVQGSGPFTLGWPSTFKWAGGAAGTISTVNGAVDLLTLTYRGDNGFYYASLGKGFA